MTSTVFVVFCEAVVRTSAEVLEQCTRTMYRAFENPRELFPPHGIFFYALVLENWKTKFGSVVRNDSTINVTAGLFCTEQYFVHQGWSKLSKNPGKMGKCTKYLKEDFF